jgi:hypothetical protein
MIFFKVRTQNLPGETNETHKTAARSKMEPIRLAVEYNCRVLPQLLPGVCACEDRNFLQISLLLLKLRCSRPFHSCEKPSRCPYVNKNG